MFEKITKGKAFADELDVYGADRNGICYCCENRNEAEENAEFIAYCFNLQQRFDISQLENMVSLVGRYVNNPKKLGPYGICDIHEEFTFALSKIHKS